MKTCTTCGIEYPLTFFNKDSQKKDGLNPRCKECSKAWHHKNKDRVKVYQIEYYKNNIEYHAKKARVYRNKNREILNLKKREWDKENIILRREYRKENSEKYACYARNRRSRIAGNGGEHSINDVLEMLRLQKNKCAICLDVLDNYHVDHIVPIAKGGTNDKYNLQILCPSCNFSKNDTDPVEYMQQKGFLL